MKDKQQIPRPTNVVHIAYLEGADVSTFSTVYGTANAARREAEAQLEDKTGAEVWIRWGKPVQDQDTGLYSWCGTDTDDKEACWVAEVEVR